MQIFNSLNLMCNPVPPSQTNNLNVTCTVRYQLSAFAGIITALNVRPYVINLNYLHVCISHPAEPYISFLAII